MSFQQIVHPTDFSAVAQNALKAAAVLARKVPNSTVHLVHVYDRPYATIAQSGAMAAVVDQQADAELRESLQNQIEAMAADPSLQGIHMTRRFVTEGPVTRFHEHLDAAKMDLIVMGTHGHRDFFHGGLVGTNTARVIRTSPVPVLAIPEKSKLDSVKTIAFATDFQGPINEHFPVVMQMAKLLGASVDIVVINTNDSVTSNRKARTEYDMLQALHPDGNLSLTIYSDNDVVSGVLHYLQDTGADMLAMYTHGRTGFNRLFAGSIVEELSEEVSVPLLAFRGDSAGE